MTSKLTGEGDDADDDVQKKSLPFSSIMTLEPRHENKNCSACLKDQLKPF